MVNGEMQIGYKSMSLEKFTEAVEKTRAACKEAGVDIIINLTTSGGEYEDYKRLQHLGALKPEMCSFDPNTLNWANSYIFENSPDGRICRNTFEWCAEGVEPQISALQHCVYERMANYHRNFDENGIFCCRDIRDLPPENYRDLARQGIVSMLQCAIRDEGRMIGFIGFDECRVNRVWTDGQARALSLVASLLGNQLVKERLRERLALAERELSQLRSAAPRR